MLLPQFNASPNDEDIFTVAKRAVRPSGSPVYSDVCFSSRWPRPLDSEDPHHTFRDASAFHATRLDWVYSLDSTWFAECKQRGYSVGGTLNSILFDFPGASTRQAGRILNLRGEPVTAPWMQSWQAWWGCVNSPQYRRTFLEHAKRMVDYGVDYIHMDDPGVNHAAVEWGGCYCRYCREEAERLQMDLETEMLAFQKGSVERFYGDIRRELNTWAGRRISFSCNNFEGKWHWPYTLFDFGMAECDHPSPRYFVHVMRNLQEHGRAQIFTYRSEEVKRTRQVIALSYACGMHLLVPYDVYLRSTATGAERYFGRPENYADLYGFIRAVSTYLDGYEDAAIAGSGLSEDRYDQNPVDILQSRAYYAFTRVRPNEQESAAVIHIVHWGDKTENVTIKLWKDYFYGEQPVRARLLLPRAYDRKLHESAEAQKDYSALVRRLDIKGYDHRDCIEYTLPAIDAWALLIVEPK